MKNAIEVMPTVLDNVFYRNERQVVIFDGEVKSSGCPTSSFSHCAAEKVDG